MNGKQIAYNKKASFEYEISDKYEAGIVLKGTEIKSLRSGTCSINEAYIIDQEDEIFIKGMTIPEFKHGNINNHDPKRLRKLLLHKKEITAIKKAVNEKGNTLIPVSVYFKGSLIKLSIAIGKGKKLYDKRNSIKDRENSRQLDRVIKDYNN